MATTKHKPQAPIDPAVFAPRIRQVEARVAALAGERTDLLYRREQEPSNPDIDKMLASVESETAAANRERQNLIDTRDEAARRWTATAQTAYVARLEADRQQVVQLEGELFEIATRTAAHIEALRPFLEQFAALGQQRADLAWGVISAGTERNRRPEHLRSLAGMSTGAAAALITAAFQRAGVGTLGPTTGITLPAVPKYPARDGWAGSIGQRVRTGPDRTTPWHVPDVDIVALAAEELQRENGSLLATMRRAIDKVAGEEA